MILNLADTDIQKNEIPLMMSSVFIGRGTQIQQSYQALYKDMNKRNFIVEDDLLSEHIAYCKI